MANQLTTIAALPSGAGCRAALPPEVGRAALPPEVGRATHVESFDELINRLEREWDERVCANSHLTRYMIGRDPVRLGLTPSA